MIWVFLSLVSIVVPVLAVDCDPGYRSAKSCSEWEYPIACAVRLPCGDCQRYHRYCVICPEGTYNMYKGLGDSCPACPAGYFSGKGNSTCSVCKSGQYGTQRGRGSCKSCPKGYYSVKQIDYYGKSFHGTTSCKECEQGRYEPSEGSDKCDNCIAGKYNQLFAQTSDTCKECEKGQFSAAGVNFCDICPAGFYQNQISQSGCEPCTAGRYNMFPAADNSTYCEACPEGYSSGIASAVCQECPVGRFNAEKNSTCKDCPLGKYNFNTGAITEEICKDCPAGKYSDSVGTSSSSCKACLGGKSSVKGSPECGPCPKGQYAGFTIDQDTRVLDCLDCSTGMYNDEEGQSSCKHCTSGRYGTDNGLKTPGACKICDSGMYNDFSGRTSCKSCPQGRYNNNPLSKSLDACTLCEVGRFNPAEGQKNCSFCDTGMYNNEIGKISCKECPVGLFNNFKQKNAISDCKECPKGYFNSETGITLCKKCLRQSYTDQIGQSSCKGCPVGKYTDRMGMVNCEEAIYLNMLDGLDYAGCDLQLTTDGLDRGKRPDKCPPLRIIDHNYVSGNLEKDYRKNGIWTDTLCNITKNGETVNVTTGLKEEECEHMTTTVWRDKICTRGGTDVIGKTLDECGKTEFRSTSCGLDMLDIQPVIGVEKCEAIWSECDFCDDDKKHKFTEHKCTLSGKEVNIPQEFCARDLISNYTRRESTLHPFDGIDVGYYSVPAFADTDNDGDMDLVIGRREGDLIYYENTGDATHASYTRRQGALNPFDGIDVGSRSVPAFVDTDNDGDMDLVVGRSMGDLLYYENTGDATHASYTRREVNPFDGVDVGYRSAPTFVDTDNDGDLDLVIGRYEGELGYYENTGNASNPSYTRREGVYNLFGRVDVGWSSVPAFVDMDNDGDMDLVIGGGEGDLQYYENTGSPADPVAYHPYLKRANTLRLSNTLMKVVNVGPNSAPTYVDMDNDGDLDLVIGWDQGDLDYYVNMGTWRNATTGGDTRDTETPVYTEGSYTRRKGALIPFDGVADVGSFSAPAFVDTDNDGDMDLVIGRSTGDLKFYENMGSAWGNLFYTRREGGLNPFDGVADVGSWSAPAFVDVDNDGDMDLVIGRYEGDLKFYYENTGNATHANYTRREGALNPFDGVADVGSKSAPAFVDTDNDGDMDLVIGRATGDLHYYENTGIRIDAAFFEPAHCNFGGEKSPFNVSFDVSACFSEYSPDTCIFNNNVSTGFNLSQCVTTFKTFGQHSLCLAGGHDIVAFTLDNGSPCNETVVYTPETCKINGYDINLNQSECVAMIKEIGGTMFCYEETFNTSWLPGNIFSILQDGSISQTGDVTVNTCTESMTYIPDKCTFNGIDYDADAISCVTTEVNTSDTNYCLFGDFDIQAYDIFPDLSDQASCDGAAVYTPQVCHYNGASYNIGESECNASPYNNTCSLHNVIVTVDTASDCNITFEPSECEYGDYTGYGLTQQECDDIILYECTLSDNKGTLSGLNYTKDTQCLGRCEWAGDTLTTSSSTQCAATWQDTVCTLEDGSEIQGLTESECATLPNTFVLSNTRCDYLTNEYEEDLTSSKCNDLLKATWVNSKCTNNGVDGLTEPACLHSGCIVRNTTSNSVVTIVAGVSSLECDSLTTTTWHNRTCTYFNETTEICESWSPTQCEFLTNENVQDLTESECNNLLSYTWYPNTQGCKMSEGALTYTLSCIDTCTEGEIKDGKICHEGHKKDHTCTLNSEDTSGCDCFGNTCSLWCLDNGECVDMLVNPTSAQLEIEFNNGVS